jgi:hypothetical protein
MVLIFLSGVHLVESFGTRLRNCAIPYGILTRNQLPGTLDEVGAPVGVIWKATPFETMVIPAKANPARRRRISSRLRSRFPLSRE